MKTFVCIGCSNGRHFGRVYRSLMPDWHVVNLSFGGAGNEFIAGRLCEYLTTQPKPDRVYVQFSGLNRIDIPMDPGEDDWGGYEYLTRTDWFTWLHSGGHHSSWHKNPRVSQLMERRRFIMENNRWPLAVRSMQQVLLSLAMCDAHQVPVTWSTYYNWRRPPNEFVHLNDGAIDRWPHWLPRDRQIEPDPFTWAERQRDTPEDGVHWSAESFESWCQGPGRRSWSAD